MGHHFLLISLVCLLLASANAAHGQGRDPAAAEILFEEAVALLKQGRSEEACPKFTESQRLDPATGTLIAVADCHERAGLLATAWSEYVEAAGRARTEQRPDRARLAEARALGLRPRLATATLTVPAEVSHLRGLRIERDGVVLGRASWNRPLPVDQGQHAVRVTAAGRAPLELEFLVSGEGTHVDVVVPQPQPQPLRRASARAQRDGLPTRRRIGVWVGVGGAGALAVSGGFLISALRRNRDARVYCEGNVCSDPRGVELRRGAVSRGNWATAFGLGGLALAATGVTLYLTDRDEEEEQPRGELSLQAGQGMAGLSWRSTF